MIRARQQKTRVACFREFQSSIAESSHQLLKDLIAQYELTDFEVTDNSIVNTINGSDFLFKGLYNNEQSIKSIEGIDIAWVEEAQAVSKSSIDVLTPTVRKEGSQIVYTYNRLLDEDAVHTRLVIEGRPNTLVINVNYDIAIKHNMMPQGILQEIEDDKLHRPALYKHKWLGEPNSLERLIYKGWQMIPEIPFGARLERYGIDFGFTHDPTAIVAIYYFNGGNIRDEIAFLKGLDGKQIADILINQPQKALSVGDSADPRLIQEIASYGVSITGAKKQGKVSEMGTESSWKRWGISVIQELPISVTQRSVNVWKASKNYMWATDRLGNIISPNEPDHLWSDAMDATRYGLTSVVPMIQRRDFIANMPRIERKERKNPAK